MSEPLMAEWKNGVDTYHSLLLLLRKDSGIASLQDLRGKVVAFEDRSSTTGFFLPYAMIRKAGMRLIELRTPRDAAPPNAVGYVFAVAEINGAVWVERGLVAAAAFNDQDWESVSRAPGRLFFRAALGTAFLFIASVA